MQSLFPNKTTEHLYMIEEDMVEKLPRTLVGLEILCEYLEANPFSASAWQSLFFDFDHLMGPKKREEMIGAITSEFDPEMIRLTLGESISEDEFFPEEKAMILSTPKTIPGIQQLLDYLKHNINCLYGWDIYFDQFDRFSTLEQQRFARATLGSTFDECFLSVRFPQQF